MELFASQFNWTDSKANSDGQIRPIGYCSDYTYTISLRLYPGRANMRGQTCHDSARNYHVDVANANVCMHNRRRALVGNVDYICARWGWEGGSLATEYTRVPNKGKRIEVEPVTASSCRTCCLHRHSN